MKEFIFGYIEGFMYEYYNYICILIGQVLQIIVYYGVMKCLFLYMNVCLKKIDNVNIDMFKFYKIVFFIIVMFLEFIIY